MYRFRVFAVVCVLAMGRVCGAQADAKPATAKAPADVLEFTNGDRLTGQLKSAADGNVVFHSDMAGDITVPFAKVKSLTSGSEFVALHALKPGKVKAVGSGKVTYEAEKVVLTPATGAEQTVATKDLSYLVDAPTYAKAVDHRATFRQGWNGMATAGLTLVRSTETTNTFTGALNLVRAIPTVPFLPNRNRTTIDVAETYGTNRTPVIPQTVPASAPVVVQTSIFHADGERDEYFSPRFFALADVSFDHNFSQGLQLQQVYGVGAGWTALQDAKQELDLRGDVHYEKQQLIATVTGSAQDNLNLIGSTFQENYRRTLPRKFVLTEWANVLPSWNDRQAYSANAYLGLTMPIFKRLGVTVGATDNYLNNPAPGYKTNSVQFVTGVTYSLK